MWRWAKNYGTHFWVSHLKRSHTCHKTVKRGPASKHMEELQQKTRTIISRSVSALSLSLSFSLLTTVYFSLPFYWRWLSSCFVFSLFSNYKWKVIANKLFYLWTKTVFWVIITFLTARLQQGSDGNLRYSATHTYPSELWWYKCLWSSVVLQASAENYNGTNIYLVL